MATISIFVGSIRKGRQGRKVADWVAGILSARGHTVHLIDPSEHPELLTLEQMYKSMENPSKDMQQIRGWVVESDGYIAVSPEYNHSFSGTLKNAIDHFLEEYFWKPFGIVTYSVGGFGGIRAAEHLRGVVAELGASAIPTSLPISKVGDVFAEDGSLRDESYNKRLSRMLDEFDWYVAALQHARDIGTP